MNSSLDRMKQVTVNTTNMTFLAEKDTIFSPTSESWTATPIILLIAFTFGCLSNGILLLLFIEHRALRTPFNIYLINLLIANLAYLCVQNSMDIPFNLYSTWFMGNYACTVYIYGSFVLEAGIMHAHQLIAINRIWAIVYPVSYRSHHSVRTALLLCVGMWVSLHLVIAPGLVADAMYYRLPVESNGCDINAAAQPIWNSAVLLLIYIPPQVVMLVGFLVIRCQTVLRYRKARRQTNIKASNSHTSPVRVDMVETHNSNKPADNVREKQEIQKEVNQGMEPLDVSPFTCVLQ